MKRPGFGSGLVVCLALVVFCAGQKTSAADGFAGLTVAADSLTSSLVNELQSQAQIYAGQMSEFLQTKLDEIDRVCNLTPEQHAKMQVAAKGAIDHALTRWLDASVEKTKKQTADASAQPAAGNAVARGVIHGGFNFGGGVLVAEDFGGLVAAPAAVQILNDGPNVILLNRVNNNVQILQANGNIPAQPQLSAVMRPLEISAIEHEIVWTTAELHVLTDAQREMRKNNLAARANLASGPPVERVMAELDRRLLLDASQREQFAKVVRPLVEQRVQSLARGQAVNVVVVANSVLRTRPPEELTRMLSERQLSIWQSVKSTTLENRGYEQ